jgi:outer membrane protein TolC
VQAEGRAFLLEMRARVQRSYVGAGLMLVRIAHADEAIQIAERILIAAERRLDTGASGEIDLASAKSELAVLRADKVRAISELERYESELRYLLDLPVETPLLLSTSMQPPGTPPNLQELLTLALRHHPELELLRRRVQLLTQAEDRLRKEAHPKLGTFVGFDASPDSPLFGIFGLSVELPVAQRNQGPRAVAMAERSTTEARMELERSRLAHDLRVARAAYERRIAELEILDQEGLPAAGRRLELVETGWRAGRFDIFRLTSASHELVTMKANRVALLEQLWFEWITLQTLSGGFSHERS